MSFPCFVLIRGGANGVEGDEPFVEFEPLRIVDRDATQEQMLDAIYHELAKEINNTPGKSFPTASEGVGDHLRKWILTAGHGQVLRLNADLAVLCVPDGSYMCRYVYKTNVKMLYTIEDDTPLESHPDIFDKPQPGKSSKPNKAKREKRRGKS